MNGENEILQVTVEVEKENNNILSSTPLPNGKTNGTISNINHIAKSPGPSPVKPRREIPHTDVVDSRSPVPALSAPDSPVSAPLDGTETKRKRPISDRAYYIAKELLASERTYRRDLEVISIWFREEVAEAAEMPDDVLTVLFSLVDPLVDAHGKFLHQLEEWVRRGEGRPSLNNAPTILDNNHAEDILKPISEHLTVLPHYEKYIDKHLLILERLDAAFRKNRKFELLYRDFELQRVCYLPLSCFIVKPLQRLIYYQNLTERLSKHYGPNHFAYKDCEDILAQLEPFTSSLQDTLKVTENFVQLSELQRDMPSFEGLVQCGREFIRQGCLSKHSRKGFQQRMFFLFSDILVYTNRTTTPTLQFKVHGQMPLRGVMVDENDERTGANFAFTLFGGNRTLALAASSQEEKDKWLEDLFEAINVARERNDGKLLQYLSLKSSSSSEEGMEVIGQDALARERSSQQRSNTTVHVCWHRNTSTSLKDHVRARSNELSGFLLRKFKNSNGWQKLWVVFTHFCLFFYKTHVDDSPLASLPLLGYTITVPNEQDDIHKDYVFKLQFKNHVYFFRAESEYTFSRWMEVVNSATQHSGRIRLFSRKESSLNNHV